MLVLGKYMIMRLRVVKGLYEVHKVYTRVYRVFLRMYIGQQKFI